MKKNEYMSEDSPYESIRIEAGTIEGVNIPCILCFPKNAKGQQKLTVSINNEDGQTLEESMENMERSLESAMKIFEFSSPVLVPILPSQAEFNKTLQSEGIDLTVGEPKQFAVECFSSKIPETSRFYRIDEQVNTLITNIISNSKLKEKIQALRENGEQIDFEDKVIGFGHSGAGAAMLRYSLLHPEILEKLIIGGNGDIVPTPVGENGTKLPYPFGIKGYEELLGREFNIEAFKKINFQFYIGDKEEIGNGKPYTSEQAKRFDTIRDENYEEGKTGNNFAPENLAKLYKQLYGTPFFERFMNALKVYEENGLNIGLKIYEDNCHLPITAEDLKVIISGERYFDSEASKQIAELLSKRREKQDDVLKSGVEATEVGKVRDGVIDEQVDSIVQLAKGKDDKTKGTIKE